MTQANDRQVAGEHYKAEYQHWDFVIKIQLPYLPAQVTKYLTRWKKKNGLQDLEKSKHFLDKYIEMIIARQTFILKESDAFWNKNDVDYRERQIMIDLMLFESNNVTFLVQAAEGIQRLINSEQARQAR